MVENSEEAISARIKAFEENENAFSYKVRGVCIWRVFRSYVFFAIQNIGLAGTKAKRKNILIASLASVCQILYAAINGRKFKYGVVSYPFALKVKNDEGAYSDFYYQTILDAVPGGVRLSNDFECGQKKNLKKGVHGLNLSAISAASIILARLRPINCRAVEYKKLADGINKSFVVDGISEASLKRWFSIFWWETQLKRSLFRVLGLQTVFIINSGEYSAINACVMGNINIVELQHGIYTQNHPDVLSGDVVIANGKHALFLPDVLALYGEYWVQKLAPGYLNSGVSVISVGNSSCDVFAPRRRMRTPGNGSEIIVLVTTQGFQKKELIAFLKDVLRMCSKRVTFILKLHPIYDKDKSTYVREFDGDYRIKVVAGDESPTTFDSLCTADLHASIASACHYDALSIGVPTVVIGLPGSELVSSIVENGSAVQVNEPGQMATLIDLQRWIQPTEEMRHFYCSPGFLKNLKRII